MLPSTTDPCGQVTWGSDRDSNESQSIGKVDYQWRTNHTIFGGYMRTFVDEFPVWEPGGNILTSSTAGGDRTVLAELYTLGETSVFGPNMVNAVRVVYNRTALRALRAPFVDAPSLGVNAFTYFPGKLTMTITGGFSVGQSDSIRSILLTDAYQVADDLTLVRGRHQMEFGGNLAVLDVGVGAERALRRTLAVQRQPDGARPRGLPRRAAVPAGAGRTRMSCRSTRRISVSTRRTPGAPRRV